MERNKRSCAGNRSSGGDGLVRELLTDLAPRIARSLQRRFGAAIPQDEIAGVINLAAARMMAHAAGQPLNAAKVQPRFYKYCYHVAEEMVAAGWNRQRRREQSLPAEVLDGCAGPATQPLEGKGDGLAPARPTAQDMLVRAALAALSERDQVILLTDACAPDGKLPTCVLAAKLGVSEAAARHARRRARARFRAALVQLGFSAPSPVAVAHPPKNS